MIGRTLLHIFSAGTVIAERYRDVILEPYGPLFRGTVRDQFVFMDDSARLHTAVLVDDYLEEANSHLMVRQRGLQTSIL